MSITVEQIDVEAAAHELWDGLPSRSDWELQEEPAQEHWRAVAKRVLAAGLGLPQELR